MRYLEIAGLPRPASQLGLGSVAFQTATRSCWEALLDAWLDAGGKLVDTARHHGEGESAASPPPLRPTRDARACEVAGRP
jgi:aryl-alcohol dehydrogenase-like predicted oxidoreductase